MYDFLKDLVVVEGATFIAGPSCSLHLQQFGAKVIRFDSIGGGPDHGRWPVDGRGHSLYWESLNRGKLSVALDLSRPEGRELATAIITSPGEGRGLFVTNYPANGFLSHQRLSALRADLITLRIQGWPDGRNGVDYSVNAAVGVPFMTGDPQANGDQPVNSALPAWDLLAGAYGAFTLLAAERRRRAGGPGGEYAIALSDLAIGSLANLGGIAELLAGQERQRYGNALYGAFGRDFLTRDGRRIMLVAITPRQWAGLLAGLGISAEIAALEAALSVSFAQDEGQRFIHRAALGTVIAQGCAARDYAELTAVLDQAGVCWEPYQTLKEAVENDPRLVSANPIFETLRQPGGLDVPLPGAMARVSSAARGPAQPGTVLGRDTEEVLADHLGLSEGQIARLVDQGLVAGLRPAAAA